MSPLVYLTLLHGIPLVQGGLPPVLLLLHLLQLSNVSLKVAPNQFNPAEIFSRLLTNWGVRQQAKQV